ncbi:MAG: RNA-splicing ligase RtcB [Zetaproteobacteria bacterium]|nr:RNA-splicing ligase RtcB [Pseudobdellovibrionaceae bacterium]
MPIEKILTRETHEDIRSPIKIWTDDIDEASMNQLRQLGALPFVYKHIAVMPDVHAGKGSTIGSVIPTKGAITPATVGVDLGCGMSAYKIPGLTPDDLEGKTAKIRKMIEKRVPVGQASHRDEDGVGFLAEAELNQLLQGKADVLARARSLGNCDRILRGANKAGPQLGTLGGGNHFIEVCVSKKFEVWLMLHTGSRGLGNLIAQHHIAVAKNLMKRAFIDLPDPDLAYLWEGSGEFEHYIADMQWAQNFAFFNRRSMGRAVLAGIIDLFDLRQAGGRPLSVDAIEYVDCHHNYVAREHHFGENVWVTRKGAVRAGIKDVGIIPGSMGAKSFIVQGRGNADAFCSCSHGAGRKMSRTAAKKMFTAQDLAAQTKGIECRKDDGVVDEIPSAYKNIDEVMANQSDLVEIKEELRQVLCVKG